MKKWKTEISFKKGKLKKSFKKGEKKRQILGLDFSNGQPRKLTKIQIMEIMLKAIVTFVKKEFDVFIGF
jgi:hypothetical protein